MERHLLKLASITENVNEKSNMCRSYRMRSLEIGMLKFGRGTNLSLLHITAWNKFIPLTLS